MAAATSPDAARAVADVLGRLTPGGGSRIEQRFYLEGIEGYGTRWRHADLLTALWAATTLLHPRSYLEVGVHRGRSAAVVAATQPECAIYGFDIWPGDYFRVASPGPDFVRGELANAGHRGDLELVSGDSRRTLPAFLGLHPDLYFDLVAIDGDKSVAGAASDFAHALPRLKVGGVVISDDLPVVPVLRRVWRAVIERDPRFRSWDLIEGTAGVAMAVRVAE